MMTIWGRRILGVLLVSVMLAGCGMVGNFPAPNIAPPGSDTSQQPSTARPSAASPEVAGVRTALDPGLVAQVYERTSPSVVNINIQARGTDQLGRAVVQEGTGSGFIIDDQGHIVTNEHVVADSNRLDVTLADGSSYVGEVVAEDPAVDLAVIRINAPADRLRQLTTARLGDSDALKVGEAVVAIGNPFGLERSASLGIVSSLGRTRPGLEQRLITDMIQTDAAINPGNSGGPLLNLAGEVVGINEQIEAPTGGNVGIGFAIPVNTLKRYLPDMLAGRTPQHAYMGVGGVALTPTLSEQLGLSTTQGLVVAVVAPGSPAARAGLRGASGGNPSSADVITQLDGKPVRSFEELAEVVNAKDPGDTVSATYLRNGQSQTADVTLGVWQGSSSAR
jgi:S1-C subfamily serine protease